MDNILMIMIGLPGSGKSTFVKEYFGDYVVCSADDYHMQDGKYVFDPKNLPAAHEACQKKAYDSMQQGKPVVIDNTNLRIQDLAFYETMAATAGYNVRYIVMTTDPEICQARNVHGVPAAIYPRLKNSLDTVVDYLVSDCTRITATQFENGV